MKRLSLLAVTAALTAMAAPARADDAEMCAEAHEADKYQLLRRLSFDLRGQPPSIEEYQALDAAEAVPLETIQQYLESDEFRLSMRRYHEAMLWPNVADVSIKKAQVTLQDRPGVPALALDNGRSKTFRNSTLLYCDDYEHTEFDPAHPGEFRPIGYGTEIDADGKEAKRDGWRWITPYADPTTQVKVCAFDAQETLVSDDGAACNTLQGREAPECGCGPNGRFCYAGPVDDIVLGLMREQLGRSVDDVTVGGRPYTDIGLSTQAHQNGKLAFWKKYLAPNVILGATFNVPDPEEEIADADWTNDDWTLVDRKGLHAGVLTLPAYLLRFQTGRARTNRFRIALGCEYFVPPEEIETTGCDPTASDLTQRCTCRYCHSKLEPMTASFGLYAEAGTTSMTDQGVFAPFDPKCVGAKTNGFCGRFYVVSKQDPRAGWLLPYQFADAHPEYEPAIEAGPRALVQSIVDDGTFAQCTVKKLFLHLVKRDMRTQGDATDEYPLLTSLAEEFAAGGYSFPSLVQSIVMLPQYRRVR